jgi:radical SAM superfamily enzyme YgiQ (UPF0313 family)
VEINSVLLVRVTSVIDKEVEHPQFFDPCYPLKYLQAGLEKYNSLKVNILDCWVSPMDVSGLVAHTDLLHPDMVVVSASSFDVHVADRFTADLKRKAKPPIVVGIGQGYYSRGKNGNSHNGHGDYDAILLGEPEEVFFRLFDCIRENRRENGESWKEHFHKRYIEGHKFLVTDPDSLPFPHYTEKELETYRSIFPVRIPKRVTWGYIIGMRGCPHNCVFCSEVMRVSVGKKIRKRSASNVVDEFEHIARQGVNIISFQDDSFSAHRGFVKGVCEELISRKSTMPWMARVRVDEVDYDILKLMKQAGCIMLGIGVESGTQRIIDDMKKTRRSEPWAELCRQVFRWTRKLGIGTNAYYVIGNPTETREEIEQTIRLAKELNSDSIQVHFYTPYPGSEAWERYKDQITDAETTEMFHYATPQFSPSKVPIEDLVTLRSRFYRRYILRPSFVLYHMWNHWRFYMHNPDILGILLGIRKVF